MPLSPLSLSPPLFPLVATSLFSVTVSLLLFCCSLFYFLDPTHKEYTVQNLPFYVWLTSFSIIPSIYIGFPGGSVGKEPTCNVGDLGSIPGLGRFPGGGHGNPLQYSCLKNPYGQSSLAGPGGLQFMGLQKVRHGREVPEGRSICVSMGDSCLCMAESEEVLKSLLMKGKEKRKNWLKIQLSKNKNKGEESRWQRNRTGRPLSLLQIHRKNNWTVNKVHKTTSDR